MTIMRGDEDVTQEILDRAEALRVGPHGTRQRTTVYGALTQSIVTIEHISRPWLDDRVSEILAALKALRASLEMTP